MMDHILRVLILMSQSKKNRSHVCLCVYMDDPPFLYTVLLKITYCRSDYRLIDFNLSAGERTIILEGWKYI